MAESNPNSFDCGAKEDIANKPYKIGDDTTYFEDPVICSGFIDVQGIPSRPTDIEITKVMLESILVTFMLDQVSKHYKRYK